MGARDRPLLPAGNSGRTANSLDYTVYREAGEEVMDTLPCCSSLPPLHSLSSLLCLLLGAPQRRSLQAAAQRAEQIGPSGGACDNPRSSEGLPAAALLPGHPLSSAWRLCGTAGHWGAHFRLHTCFPGCCLFPRSSPGHRWVLCGEERLLLFGWRLSCFAQLWDMGRGVGHWALGSAPGLR